MFNFYFAGETVLLGISNVCDHMMLLGVSGEHLYGLTGLWDEYK